MKKISYCYIISILIIYITTSCKIDTDQKQYLITFKADTVKNYRKLEKQFLIGSHLCRKPMPDITELKHDMFLLKRNSFNYIKIQTHWALDEPIEGVYDFSDYEELISYAEELDLQVYVGLTCEQAPGWLWEKYPDCRMVGKNGMQVSYEAPYTLPSDGKPGPCFDSKGARNAMTRYIKALVSKLGKHKNVGLWNTWQEIAYWPEYLVNTSVCYCSNTQEHFREWLKTKYGSLDSLNHIWHTAYADWRYVKPNMGPLVGTRLDMDWKYFMDNIHMAQTLQVRAQAIREADPYKRPVFAHPSSPTIGSGSDWTYARCQEFIGSSAYPCGSFRPWDDGYNDDPKDQFLSLSNECIDLSLNYDYIRCANPMNHPIIAAEFQGGPLTNNSGFTRLRLPNTEDIRRWMFSVVGSGATGISFWVTRDEIMAQEANSFGLLDTKGDSTERFLEAGRIAKSLNCYPELFAVNNREPGKVAIIVNEQNWDFCSSLPNYSQHLAYSTRGWYRLLFEAGIPVDFIELSDLEDKNLNNYKVAIMPVPVSISDEYVKKLVNYVDKGGNLISEACPGRFTDEGLCRRSLIPSLFEQLFGVEEINLQYLREPDNGHRWTSRESCWNGMLNAAMLEGVDDFKGLKIRANAYIESLKTTTGEPFLKYNSQTVGAINAYGKGKAWILGTFAGHNGTAYQDEETRIFIKKMLHQCGISPSHEGKLVIRKRIGNNKQAWIVTNPTKATITEKLDCNNYTTVKDLLGLPFQRSGNQIDLTLKSWESRILLVE